MSGLFGVFENGKLKGMYSGDKTPFIGHAEVIDLPDDFNGWVGIDQKELDSEGYIISLPDRIALGFITVDKYHKLVGEEILAKTDHELMLEGLLAPPAGVILKDGSLVPMTEIEQMEAGLIDTPLGWKILDHTLIEMTDGEKIEAGLFDLPEGMVVGPDDALRTMTQDERYIAGLDSLPENKVIEAGVLRQKTNREIWETRYIADSKSVTTELLYFVSARLRDKLDRGFSFGAHIIQADAVAQQNANGFLTAATAGLDIFPIVWRTKENINIEFTTASEFKDFATSMLSFVQAEYHLLWKVKDVMRVANDFGSLYDAYMGYME